MADTNITPFNFNNNDVRVIMQDGEPWFVATDVAESLGYKSPKDASSCLDDDEKGSATIRTLGGEQKLTIINESGLYALVLRSRKPEARKFAKWVTAEVLPTIRKTGRYEHAPADLFGSRQEAPITDDQQAALRAILEDSVKTLPVAKQGPAMIRGWSKLKSHFGVSYRQIPAHRFTEAASILSRHVVEVCLEDERDRTTSISMEHRLRDAAQQVQAIALSLNDAANVLTRERGSVGAAMLTQRLGRSAHSTGQLAR